MNIIIVDDEKMITEDLRADIKELFPNATVDIAYDADAALSLAKDKEYAVALLDIEMPGTGGIDLARRLIARYPAINIIFVTGYKQYALDAHELYCSAFLLKPVDRRKLKKAFENLRRPFIDFPENFSSDYYQGNSAIGKHLEVLRKQRNISTQKLADLMGVTRQTIYRWESGERTPDVVTLFRLIRLLGGSVEELFKHI